MQHRNHLVILSLLSVTLLAGWAFTAFGGKPTTWDVEAAKRKADYIFVRAIGAFSTDSDDVGMRLMRRAAALNPADNELRAQMAMAQLTCGPADNDSVVATLYQDLLAEFRNNPADYIQANMVANVAEHLKRFDDLIEIYTALDSLFPAKTTPAAELATAYLTRYVTSNDTNDYNKSLNILNRLERGTGKDLGLSSQKVRAYALRSDTAAIINELNSLAEALPADPRVGLLSASIYEALNIDTLILPGLKQSLAIDPNFGQGLMALADYYRNNNDSAAYDSTVFCVLKSPDVDVEAKYNIMRTYLSTMFTDSTQWQRINNLFDVLLQVNPGEYQIHRLYGTFEMIRDSKAAADQFAFAVALNPRDNELRSIAIQTMLTAADQGHKQLADSAISLAKQGMIIAPDNLYFPIMAASTLNVKGQTGDAIALMRGVDISDVRNPGAVSSFLTTLGDLYYHNHEADSAFAIYKRALDLYPQNDMAANNYAYYLAETGVDLDKALSLSQQTVLSQPDNPTYLDTYAWIYFKKKDYKEAKIQIDRVLELYALNDSVPDNDFIVEDDSLNINDGSMDAVDEQITDEDASEAPTADVYEHAGDIYFMNGEPQKAVEFWEKALALDPENALLAKKVKNKAYYYE